MPMLRVIPPFDISVHMFLTYHLTGPKSKEIKVETFRIDYLIRGPKVEKLSLQPISHHPKPKLKILGAEHPSPNKG